jgi:hypothetical protein
MQLSEFIKSSGRYDLKQIVGKFKDSIPNNSLPKSWIFITPSNDGPSYFTSKNKSSNLMSFSGNNVNNCFKKKIKFKAFLDEIEKRPVLISILFFVITIYSLTRSKH